MDLFSELISAVQSDLTIGDESTLYPLATIKLAINRAYRKSGGLFRWPELEDAKVTTTQLDINYYDYPQAWIPSSIWKLVVGTADYGDPIAYKDFLYETENDIPCGEDYLWANQWRRYFIYPTPTAAGTNITIWGQMAVTTLTADADVTIWSYSMPECNEAVVLEAVAILKAKGEEEKSGEFRSAEAKQILVVAWSKIKQDRAKYEKTTPFFNVKDMFGKTKTSDIIGNF